MSRLLEKSSTSSSSTRKGKATFLENDVPQEETKRNTDYAGLCCPICMEPWTLQGLHQVCCLACGHVFGMSCISRWIQECGKRSKCPQCNVRCRQKDVRRIYASPVYLADEDLPKKQGILKDEVSSRSRKVEVNKTKHASVSEVEIESVDSTSRLDNLRRIDARSRLETVTKMNAGMLTSMHVLMAVLSLLICAAVYISLRHSIWMFLVTIFMFLVAIFMSLVDEFLN